MLFWDYAQLKKDTFFDSPGGSTFSLPKIVGNNVSVRFSENFWEKMASQIAKSKTDYTFWMLDVLDPSTISILMKNFGEFPEIWPKIIKVNL